MPDEPALGYPLAGFSGAAPLARRKKKKKIDAAREARGRARAAIGQPPRERVIENKRRKPPKHTKKLDEEEIF